MKRFIRTLLCTLPLLSMSSCTTHLTDLSIISNKNIELNKINIDRQPQRKHVKGTDSKFVFLFIPFGMPQLKEAVNKTMKAGQGDLIIDASVYYKEWWFLVGMTSIEVRGTVVNTKGATQ